MDDARIVGTPHRVPVGDRNAAQLRRDLSPLMVRALAWWTHNGVVHCDVAAPTKTGLVRRGLAEWVAGDDLCPRLTVLGAEVRQLLLAETAAPERTEPA